MFNAELNQANGTDAWEAWMKSKQRYEGYCEQLFREWTSFIADTTATVIKGVQACVSMKKPEDLVEARLKLIAEQGEKTWHYIQGVSHVLRTAYEEQQTWMQKYWSAHNPFSDMKPKDS